MPQRQLLQLDHNKTPLYYGIVGKDSLTPKQWVNRIDQMKIAHNWAEEAAYSNAMAALFDKAASWAEGLAFFKAPPTTWNDIAAAGAQPARKGLKSMFLHSSRR